MHRIIPGKATISHWYFFSYDNNQMSRVGTLNGKSSIEMGAEVEGTKDKLNVLYIMSTLVQNKG